MRWTCLFLVASLETGTSGPNRYHLDQASVERAFSSCHGTAVAKRMPLGKSRACKNLRVHTDILPSDGNFKKGVIGL